MTKSLKIVGLGGSMASASKSRAALALGGHSPTLLLVRPRQGTLEK